MKNAIFWGTLALAAAVTGLAAWISWAFFVEPMNRAVKTANTLASAFESAIQMTPRIAINQAVVISQNSPTFELTTMEREVLVRHTLRETWLHSTKEFEIEAPFTAKAGIPLRDEFSVDLLNGGQRAIVRLPRAKLLSLEMGELRILRDEDGLWNKLTANDRERAIRDLRLEARRQILATDLLTAAATEAKKRVAEIFSTAGTTPEFASPSTTPRVSQ
ncbi:MAG: DUF4230 domain-containing protein [Terrimicrobiaceae bacterium]|nr:DUF4230 domain-containing protein [Terrimicrobiaceae bacterium]